ncbi:endonuclease/exonuclease/phosphatase family protein [Micromonospora sp. NPDC049374]|uniref:endonuclease/exonuclease/phosphatase family protein n=1 Tax=Micromonospora sp. NPDC049374 TaxID=3154352 RepID=UPI003413BE3F
MVFALAHVALSGRFWLWTLPGMLPPVTFVAIPFLLMLLASLARGRRVRTATASLVALLASFPFSGVNLAALDGAERVATNGPTLRVLSLNTDYWGQVRDGIWAEKRDRGRLLDYLRSLDADVYLLQEHMLRVDNRPQPITDLADARAAFPGYQVVAAGTLLTLSRLPVVGHDVVHSRDEPVLQFPAPYGLRVDVQVGGRTLSTYNVHMPVQLLMEESPFSGNFYREIRERHERRSEEYRALTADVKANRNPLLVAGDFNTSPAMGDNRALLNATTDAAASSGDLYPVSWRVGGQVPKLWRNDWALLGNGARAVEYGFVDSMGNSDHAAQRLTVTLGDGRTGEDG